MKEHVSTRALVLLVVTILISSCIEGCHRSTNDASGGNVVNISPKLEKIFSKTRLICFGRLVMQVPHNSTVVYGPAELESSIEYREGEASRLKEYVSERMEKIDKQRMFFNESRLVKLPLFGKILDGARAGQKIVIGSDDRVGYTILSLVPVSEDMFVQEVYGVLPEDNFVDRMNRVAAILQTRDVEEIPADPGFCIEGGFVTGKYQYERATVGIRLIDFPDVHISIDVHKNLEFLNNDSNPKKLHERALENAEAAGLGSVFSRRKILRDQMRRIGHWDGQEMALRTPAYKRASSVHEFHFYSPGSVNDPFHPQLDIRLDSGVSDNAKGAVKPSISDEEALALWDLLVGSIRPREPKDATLTKRDKVPLDTSVETGRICPESGWWETTHSDATHSNRRRLIRAGDIMPAVINSARIGLWAKFFGQRQLSISTTWKLVAYGDDTTKDDEVAEPTGLMSRTDGNGGDHA